MPLVIYYIIIALLALAVSMALRPKVDSTAAAVQDKTPTTEDGLAAKHHFGEVWVDDEFLLAWKVVGTIPIKTKSGK